MNELERTKEDIKNIQRPVLTYWVSRVACFNFPFSLTSVSWFEDGIVHLQLPNHTQFQLLIGSHHTNPNKTKSLDIIGPKKRSLATNQHWDERNFGTCPFQTLPQMCTTLQQSFQHRHMAKARSTWCHGFQVGQFHVHTFWFMAALVKKHHNMMMYVRSCLRILYTVFINNVNKAPGINPDEHLQNSSENWNQSN